MQQAEVHEMGGVVQMKKVSRALLSAMTLDYQCTATLAEAQTNLAGMIGCSKRHQTDSTVEAFNHGYGHGHECFVKLIHSKAQI